MKYIFFIFLLFIISIPTAFAETIQVNNGTSNTQVHVETSGDSTETNISVESNGVKKEIHSTTPGTIDVKINGDEAASITTTPGVQETPTASPSVKIKHLISKSRLIKHPHFFDAFFLQFKTFFENFLH